MQSVLRLNVVLAILLFLGSVSAAPTRVNELRRGRRATSTFASSEYVARDIIAKRQFRPKVKRQSQDCPSTPLPSGVCTQQCPTGFIPQIDGSCKRICATGSVLQPDNTCLVTCASGFTAQPDGTCKCNGLLLPLGVTNICITTGCPAGTKQGTNSEGAAACIPCGPNFVTCDGPNPTCATGFTYNPTTQTCDPSTTTTPTCATGEFLNTLTGLCVNACPSGTFTSTNPISGLLDCVACGVLGATSCTNNGQTATACDGSLLNLGLVLDPILGTCVAVCPPGTYEDSGLGQCLQCALNPSACTGTTPTCGVNLAGIQLVYDPILNICTLPLNVLPSGGSGGGLLGNGGLLGGLTGGLTGGATSGSGSTDPVTGLLQPIVDGLTGATSGTGGSGSSDPVTGLLQPIIGTVTGSTGSTGGSSSNPISGLGDLGSALDPLLTPLTTAGSGSTGSGSTSDPTNIIQQIVDGVVSGLSGTSSSTTDSNPTTGVGEVVNGVTGGILSGSNPSTGVDGLLSGVVNGLTGGATSGGTSSGGGLLGGLLGGK